MEKKLKTIKISGKDYVTVNERIKEFRTNPKYEGWTLTTEILQDTPERILMRATIKDKNDRIIADGLAYEVPNSSFINKSSYIENAQTSAWGRALGCIGIGCDESIASFEEVANARLNQSQEKIEYSNKNCPNCQSAMIKKESKYKAGDFYYHCPKCKKNITEKKEIEKQVELTEEERNTPVGGTPQENHF